MLRLCNWKAKTLVFIQPNSIDTRWSNSISTFDLSRTLFLSCYGRFQAKILAKYSGEFPSFSYVQNSGEILVVILPHDRNISIFNIFLISFFLREKSGENSGEIFQAKPLWFCRPLQHCFVLISTHFHRTKHIFLVTEEFRQNPTFCRLFELKLSSYCNNIKILYSISCLNSVPPIASKINLALKYIT